MKTFELPAVSVQIPGRLLPAGTYWFEVLPQNAVRIFNSDRSTLIATLVTHSAELSTLADETTVILADRGTTQPGAIVTWFYPGKSIGHVFRYSQQDQKEIAQAKQRTLAVGD